MLKDIIQERLKKRNNLQKAGYNPYPTKVERKHLVSEVLSNFFWKSLLKIRVSVAGRIIGQRNQGGVFFLDLQDETGKIQIVGNEQNLKDYELFRDNLDIGDFISVSGVAFKTKKGQQSILAKQITIAAKSLRPLPSVWHGLKDVEERFRKRYLDLIFNKEVKKKILFRSKITAVLRQILEQDGFLEVETPMLQPLPGGATARPFKTHHNALNADFYLRIAPELYLKRLLVGGLEKIFEIGRVFRNEGMDRDHNPEFTMLELYWAYQDYKGMMIAVRNWLLRLVGYLDMKEITYNGKKINFEEKWPVITYEEAIRKYSGKDLKKLNEEEIDEVFKKAVRPKIIQPTFVIHYPKVISPLAKSYEDNLDFTERFQLIVAGTELANAFSELNDPQDQRERMEAQEKKYRAGHEEVSRLDEDFLEALEYGMPPAAGLGIGIDRLVAILTNSHAIKEIIIFPTLKPK
jgi:lysyl-tRNA synthetase class 2